MYKRSDELAASLTDMLADTLASDSAISVERREEGVAILGTDLLVAVVAIWENPQSPPDGVPRGFGVQIGMVSDALFDDVAYEYSYGFGTDDEAAALDALQRWAMFDLPVLIEAFTGELDQCQLVEIDADEDSAVAAGKWQIYVGPLNYVAGNQGAQPCCQMCLLTMSLPSLFPAMAEPDSFAIKLVATRGDDGRTSADVRLNGDDLPDAQAAIAEAAKQWPDMAGLQLRRQYLYMRGPEPADPA